MVSTQRFCAAKGELSATAGLLDCVCRCVCVSACLYVPVSLCMCGGRSLQRCLAGGGKDFMLHSGHAAHALLALLTCPLCGLQFKKRWIGGASRKSSGASGERETVR